MRNNKSLRITMAILMTLVLTTGLFGPVSAQVGRLVEVQILAINDFHGQLEPPAGSGGRVAGIDAGGIEYLATHLRQLEATNKNTLFVSAGDLVGASPLTSALFQDEPTIEALSLLGMDYSAVGNHEFDEGWRELLRLANGGCHPEFGCFTDTPFQGAGFDYLTANVFLEETGRTLFQPYAIANFTGARVGIIGVSLTETPSIVTAAGVEGLQFEDEIAAINRTVERLTRMRVNTIIVLIHEGGFNPLTTPEDINNCNLSGPILDVVAGSNPEVDAFITGHTHNAYVCDINGTLVTGALSHGRLITDIDLVIDKSTGDVVQSDARNVIVTRDVPRDPQMTALVERYRTLAAPLAGRIVGSITADITRTANAAGESALGDVIADAQLWASANETYGNAQIAFMNPGGIRADLTYAQISAGEAPGEVTYGEAFAVQPFTNYLVSMDLTGEQIRQLLEQQFDNPNPGERRILQVSEGFTYTWDADAPAGSRVSDIMLNGEPLDPNATYRVTVNSFLADGGDNFTVLREGTNRFVGEIDLDALVAYFGANSPVAPGPMDRITMVP